MQSLFEVRLVVPKSVRSRQDKDGMDKRWYGKFNDFGVRTLDRGGKRSATLSWMSLARVITPIQSGVALRLPPHSKGLNFSSRRGNQRLLYLRVKTILLSSAD